MFQLGDKVKLSDFYLSNYCGVAHLKDVPAEITGIDIRFIKHDDLVSQKDGYQRYLAKYGKLERYEVITLRVRYPECNSVYIMSQFGVDPIK